MVVPVFNGALTLSSLVAQLVSLFETMRHPFEVILVNDCSRDDSWAVIADLVAAIRASAGSI